MYAQHRIASIFLAFFLASAAMAQDGEFRKWTAATGDFTVDAALAEVSADAVKLRRADNGRIIDVPLASLSEDDQRHAKRVFLDQQDYQQYVRVRDHLATVQERPATVAGLLIELHKLYPHSPYAGLWAAVTMSAGENRHKPAAAMLRQTIDRIEEQRKVDSSRHAMTLCAAHNNLAVCALKDQKAETAASSWLKAIEAASYAPSLITHNIQSLTEIAQAKGSLLSLSSTNQHNLLNALAVADVTTTAQSLDPGWYYMLDFNVPNDAEGALKVQGIDAPQQGLELLAVGSGIVVSPGVVLTVRPVVETEDFAGPKLVTVVEHRSGSKWRSRSAQNVLVMSAKRQATSAFATSVTGPDGESFDAATTHYQYLQPIDGHTGAELAALRVPGLEVAPVPVAATNPSVGTEVEVLGFRRGPDILQAGVTRETGSVLRTESANHSTYVSARVLGGNRGGPVIDAGGNIIGLAFDTPPAADQAAGLCYGIEEVRRWFYEHVQTSDLMDPVPGQSPAQRAAAVAAATVPVLCWGAKRRSEQQLFSEFADASRAGAGLHLRDGWCIACGGNGFVDCANRHCAKGVVHTPTRVQIGVNQQTGGPIYSMKTRADKCTVCNGAGRRRCIHCKNGRI